MTYLNNLYFRFLTQQKTPMKSSEIATILEQNNYNYSIQNEIITVKLDFAQKVIIDLSNPQKTILKDQLSGWNFLTGYIKMSLKNAILYNFVLILFFGFLSQYAVLIGHNITSLLILAIGWIIIFVIYYTIKLESFKLQFLALTK